MDASNNFSHISCILFCFHKLTTLLNLLQQILNQDWSKHLSLDTSVCFLASKIFHSLGLGIEISGRELKHRHSNSWLPEIVHQGLMLMKMSNKSSKLNVSLSFSIPSPPFSPFWFFLSSGRSSRAYKVAGITLLACVLIAGQAMIAYFLLSQRSDIKSLEEQSNNLKSEIMRGRPGEENRLSSDRKGCADTVGIQ